MHEKREEWKRNPDKTRVQTAEQRQLLQGFLKLVRVTQTRTYFNLSHFT